MEKGVVWPSAGGIGREGAGKPGPGYLRKKREGGREVEGCGCRVWRRQVEGRAEFPVQSGREHARALTTDQKEKTPALASLQIPRFLYLLLPKTEASPER